MDWTIIIIEIVAAAVIAILSEAGKGGRNE